jgi:serine/threonine-protein kinase
MALHENLGPGTVLGGFQLEKELGRGGMGVVFKAHELSLNRKVALKVISEHLASDTEFLARFKREAQVIARMDHPNIVRVLSFGDIDGLTYFAMEYVSGKDLGQLLREKGQLGVEQALSIGSQIAGALAEAEAQGVVHRDLKPSNIMLDSLGRVKVTDFGVAHLQDTETQLTRTGLFLGSPEYASPEQAAGKPLDTRSDIYALGAILYRSLSGQSPVTGDSPLAMITKIVTEPLTPIRELNPALPDAVCSLIDTMLAKDAGKRFQHPNEVIEAIDRCIETLKMDVPLTGFKHIPFKAEQAGGRTRKVRVIGGILGVALSILIVFWLVDAGLKKEQPGPSPAQESGLAEEGQPPQQASSSSSTPVPAESSPEQASPSQEDTPGADTAATRPETGPGDGTQAPAEATPESGDHAAPSGQLAEQPAQEEALQAEGEASQQASLPKQPSLPSVPTVLMAVWGEQVMVPNMKANLENALFGSGLNVASVSQIPVLRQRIQYGQDAIDWYSVQQVVPRDMGHILILAEIQKMGSVPLEYYGRTQELITSTYTVRAVDMDTGTAVAPSLSGTVKYTSLNAQEKLQGAVLPAARRLGSQIKSFWQQKRARGSGSG